MFDKKKFATVNLVKFSSWKKNFAVDPDWIWIQQSLDPDTDHDFANAWVRIRIQRIWIQDTDLFQYIFGK